MFATRIYLLRRFPSGKRMKPEIISEEQLRKQEEIFHAIPKQ
jgi:hypothetical protein